MRTPLRFSPAPAQVCRQVLRRSTGSETYIEVEIDALGRRLRLAAARGVAM